MTAHSFDVVKRAESIFAVRFHVYKGVIENVCSMMLSLWMKKVHVRLDSHPQKCLGENRHRRESFDPSGVK